MSSTRKSATGRRHVFLPDCQVKPGVATDHLEWAGRYIASKRPEVVICAGDFYDMPSLSSWDRGKKSAEGRRYKEDIKAGNDALDLLDRTIRRHAGKSYTPRKLVTLGNHEDRITRAVEEDARLDGQLSLDDLAFKRNGWSVHEFLSPVIVDGVSYQHFSPLSANGSVTNSRNGAPSARAQGQRIMRSAVSGHRQGLDIALIPTPERMILSVIAGSFYLHDELYLSPVGNTGWRGLVVLNDVRDGGTAEPMPVSLDYLERRFG
jgi:hypothetical protein